MFGNGRQQRDFTYIDDIARGTVAAIRDLEFATINLGADRPVPLLEVIDTIGKLVGRSPTIEFRPAHPADVPATWANIERARQLLGWTPQVSLADGLQRTVDWYRAHRELALSIALGG